MRAATPRSVHPKSAQIARDRRWREGLDCGGRFETLRAEYARAASSHPAFRTDRRQFDCRQFPRYRLEPSFGAQAAAVSPIPAAIRRDKRTQAQTPRKKRGMTSKCEVQ